MPISLLLPIAFPRRILTWLGVACGLLVASASTADRPGFDITGICGETCTSIGSVLPKSIASARATDRLKWKSQLKPDKPGVLKRRRLSHAITSTHAADPNLGGPCPTPLPTLIAGLPTPSYARISHRMSHRFPVPLSRLYACGARAPPSLG